MEHARSMTDRVDADGIDGGRGHPPGSARSNGGGAGVDDPRLWFPVFRANGAANGNGGPPGIRLRKRRRLPGPFTGLPALRRGRR